MHATRLLAVLALLVVAPGPYWPTMTLAFSDHRDRVLTRIASEPAGGLAVHGIAVRRGAVWLVDNTSGFLYRFG